MPVKLLVKSCPDAFFRMGDEEVRGRKGTSGGGGIAGGDGTEAIAPDGQSFPAPAPDVTEAMTDEAGSAV